VVRAPLDGVVARARDYHTGGIGELEAHPAVRKPLPHVGDLQVDDLLDLLQRQRLR